MKPYKIILFTIAIFTLMALIGYLLPTEGITIGSIKLSFPSPKEIMQNDDQEEYAYKPLVDINKIFFGQKAILEHIQKQIEEEQVSEYTKMLRKTLSFKYSPSYPNNDIEWIFPIFEALENAKNKKVRIIHYGDSQIEGDRMSNYLRTALQQQFGGYGVGLIPAIQTIPSASIGQKCSKSLTRYLVYGTKSMRMSERNYGPLGQTTQLYSSATFSFFNPNYSRTPENTKHFSKITILLDDIKDEVSATLIIDEEQTLEPAQVGEYSITFYLPDSTTKASVQINGQTLIHGFMLDGGNNGVQLDNAAMRGCSGTIFTSINSQSLNCYYKENIIPLIILQFGGNSVPYTKTNKAIKTYTKQLENQIKYFKSISPQSKILFIGPSDMSTNINGTMQTYPHLPKLIESLREMCLLNNVAYWDLYRAMGGYNSMVNWVNSKPQLAGSDHIHFTYTGSNHASEMLWQGLMKAYELYKIKEQ